MSLAWCAWASKLRSSLLLPLSGSEDGVVEGAGGPDCTKARRSTPDSQSHLVLLDPRWLERQPSAAHSPKTHIAALWPGIPLTAPPRKAEEPARTTRGNSVSTPHEPTSCA